MSIQRRNLLLSALPLSAALFLEAGLQPLVAESEMEEPSFDQDTYDFWTSQVREPSQGFAEHGRIVSHRGLALPNEAEFLFYSTETGFVRAASTETDTPVSKSLLEKGDASLLLSVDTVRPSNANMQKILDQKNGSLRIDLKQAIPLQQLSETLNWSAIASLLPGEQPFSGYHEIAFDPKSTWGQAKKVPLSGGIGFWSWNFSTQQKPSIWTQVMGIINGNSLLGSSSTDTPGGAKGGSGAPSGGKKAKAASTILGIGLPSIAKTALEAFNGLFGSMLAKGGNKNEWIIHNADTPLLATQDARQKHPGHAVALRSGAYLVLEAEHSQQLLSGKYQLHDGVVVPVDTKEADLDDAAKSTLPEVSYIALSTVVQPIG
jgi:hypothetical protein